MATEIIMPVLGMTMESGIIVEWMKEEGDSVAEGEVLFNVETDKSVMEVEAKASGTLLKILHGPGDDVPIQQVIGYIGEAGEAIAEAVDASAPGDGDAATVGTTAGTANGTSGGEDAPAAPTDGAADGTTGGQDDAAAAGATTPGPSGRVKISPKARRHARDLGIAIEHIAGTGPSGRIVFSDVEAFAARSAAAAPSAGPGSRNTRNGIGSRSGPCRGRPGFETRPAPRPAQRTAQGRRDATGRKRVDRSPLLPHHGRGHVPPHRASRTTDRLW